jgi:hypothetical protein
MPAKWQQWMPFKIDAFRGSPTVQAMHPCARIGYLYLLACAWQTEDCTIPNDPFELAEISGLGDELWQIHGPRILRKFETVTARSPSGNGTVTAERLQNAVCFQEWKEAKRVFDARQKAADRTNAARSPHGHRHGEPSGPSRSADTRTTVVPVYVEEGSSLNNDSGSELILATWLFEELGIVGGFSEQRVAAEAIRLLAKEGGTTKNAADYILAAGKQAIAAGEVIDRFWFTGQKYRPQIPRKTPRQAEREARRKAVLEAPID